MRSAKIKSAIVCDTVRVEADSNKHILVGVYSGDIVLHKVPIALKLDFWLEVLPKRLGDILFDVKLSFPGQVKPFLGKAESHIVTLDSPTILTFSGPQTLVSEAGTLSLSVRESEESRWEKVISKKVLLAD